VQAFRDRIYIWDFAKLKFRSLHSYVPFYFATRSPMLHNKYTEGVQDKIVIFEFSRSILSDQGVLFTNGNASNQQLSKFRGEQVGITPAIIGKECIRRYYPGGPYGSNAKRTDFYSDLSYLDRLDWDCINNIHHVDPLEEYIRIRHSEVLVPDLVPLGRVNSIFVRTPDMVQTVNVLIEECGLTGRIPASFRRTSFYF
jgi:hypothetical protein